MTSSEPRSFLVNGALYQILFLVTEAVRLVPRVNETSPSSEPVTAVECRILDETLTFVAAGHAVKSSDDEYSELRGRFLSLSRALDYAEANVPGWSPRESFNILEDFLKHESFDVMTDLSGAEWTDWFLAATHADEAKVILAHMDAVNAKPAVERELPIFWKGPKALDYTTYWMWDGEKGYWLHDNDWSRGDAEFTVRRMDEMYPRVADPRSQMLTGTPADTETPMLILNDTFRRDAERMGVRLDYPAGALTMADLSRLYHAMKRTQLVEAQVSQTLYEPIVRSREQFYAMQGLQ